jgi:hypothetical protein
MSSRVETLRTELLGRIQTLQAKFTPLYLMVGLSLALHVATLVKLFS